MKTILSIGYNHYLVPASVNINHVLAALQKCTMLEHKYERGGYYLPKDEEPRIEVKLVQDQTVRDRPKRKALPEVASPDAHNTF